MKISGSTRREATKKTAVSLIFTARNCLLFKSRWMRQVFPKRSPKIKFKGRIWSQGRRKQEVSEAMAARGRLHTARRPASVMPVVGVRGTEGEAVEESS